MIHLAARILAVTDPAAIAVAGDTPSDIAAGQKRCGRWRRWLTYWFRFGLALATIDRLTREHHAHEDRQRQRADDATVALE